MPPMYNSPPCQGVDLHTLVRDLPGSSINSSGIDIKTVCHGLLRSTVNEHDAMKVKTSNSGNPRNRKSVHTNPQKGAA